MDARLTLQQALQLHQQGKFAGAERGYRAVLQQEPFNAVALHNLGLIAREAGHLKPAMDLITQSLALDPGNVNFRVNQIGLFDLMGQHQAAEEAARKLITERPTDLKLRVELARLLTKYKKFDEAAEQWEFLVTRAPQDPAIHFHYGVALEEAGHSELAEQRYEAAVALKPDLGEAIARLGTIALRRGQKTRAADLLRRAAALMPGNPDVLSNLATALVFQNRVDEARRYAKAACDLASTNPVLVSAYANVLLTCGDVPEAIGAYSRAVELARNPLEYYSDLLFTRLYLEAPGAEELQHHRGFQQQCAQRVAHRPAPPRELGPGERLRIGYVSADFQIHPVGLFMEPLLAHHDRSRFEVHCFSTTTFRDALTDRIRASVDEFHEIRPNTSFDKIDALVRSRQIDILIDLAGHTGTNCLQLFARKPAPVQITYLGYPNTTGLEAIDFRITDAIADPPGATEAFHSEVLLRLPDSFALFSPPPGAPEVRSSPHLEKGYVTFGTLARIEKWSSQSLESWSRILAAVPTSRFRLIGPGYDDPVYQEYVTNRLSAYGIDPARLDMVGHKPFAEYLAEISNFDLLLDTNPFNCHTTTLQALYMGVPTVTLQGALHRSRMGASVLTALGLTELIATAGQDYERIAIGLAGNPTRLAEMRNTLRDRLLDSSLCDAPTFARGFEACLIDAWTQKLKEST